MSFYDNILGRLAATIWTGTFFSCEKVSTSVSPASGGLCPLDTHDPFKKVSIPNFLTYFAFTWSKMRFGLRTHAGVLAFFETRKGIEKIPVVPTGKPKLHVIFPSFRKRKMLKFSFILRKPQPLRSSEREYQGAEGRFLRRHRIRYIRPLFRHPWSRQHTVWKQHRSFRTYEPD